MFGVLRSFMTALWHSELDVTVSLSGGWAEREGGAYAQVRKGPPRGYSTLLNAHTFLRPITDPDSLLARLPGAPKTRVQPELPDIRVRVQTDFSLVPRNRGMPHSKYASVFAPCSGLLLLLRFRIREGRTSPCGAAPSEPQK